LRASSATATSSWKECSIRGCAAAYAPEKSLLSCHSSFSHLTQESSWPGQLRDEMWATIAEHMPRMRCDDPSTWHVTEEESERLTKTGGKDPYFSARCEHVSRTCLSCSFPHAKLMSPRGRCVPLCASVCLCVCAVGAPSPSETALSSSCLMRWCVRSGGSRSRYLSLSLSLSLSPSLPLSACLYHSLPLSLSLSDCRRSCWGLARSFHATAKMPPG
jgi:hypothetical protein